MTSATPGTLSPHQAANIAFSVYELKGKSVAQASEVSRQKRGLVAGMDHKGNYQAPLFQDTSIARFDGRSGIIVRLKTGFGYVAEGVGQFDNHVLLATRGTASWSDAMTDLQAGMQPGPTGTQVHVGFNRTWKTYFSEVQKFLEVKKPAHIHCVGHSLGGALAMLNAAAIIKKGLGPVSVYTFGAPRVGSSWFAAELTKAANIYRVSHMADPVPMIPCVPFFHAPYGQPSFVLGEGLFNPFKHMMENSYLPMTKDLTWGNCPTDAKLDSDESVKAWLASAGDSGRIKMGSSFALYMIGKALNMLLKTYRDVCLGALAGVATAAFTVLDRIASMLYQGARLSVEFGRECKALVGAVMKFLGRAANTAQELTHMYLRWVFDLLFRTISTAAVRAIQLGGN